MRLNSIEERQKQVTLFLAQYKRLCEEYQAYVAALDDADRTSVFLADSEEELSRHFEELEA